MNTLLSLDLSLIEKGDPSAFELTNSSILSFRTPAKPSAKLIKKSKQEPNLKLKSHPITPPRSRSKKNKEKTNSTTPKMRPAAIQAKSGSKSVKPNQYGLKRYGCQSPNQYNSCSNSIGKPTRTSKTKPLKAISVKPVKCPRINQYGLLQTPVSRSPQKKEKEKANPLNLQKKSKQKTKKRGSKPKQPLKRFQY